MRLWGLCSIVAAFALSFGALTPVAVAQDAQSTLKEAVDLYERGQNDAALEKLRAVLATDPSSEQAWSLRNAVEQDLWARIMIKGEQHQAVVSHLFRLAIPAERAQASNDEAIKGLVEKLDSPDWAVRQKASLQLAADHGEYAVAYLARRLGSDDTDLRAGTMEWIRRMGRRATMPLIQMLDSGSPLVVANCLTLLGQCGDVRALPYVAAMASMPAEGAGVMVKKAGIDARNRLGSAAETQAEIGGLFFAVAEGYYQRNGNIVVDGTTVWNMEEGKLVAREVPAALYHLKLAEDILYDMLNYAPESVHTQVLLASVLVAQADAAAGMAADEAAKAAGAAEASTLAKALGAEVLNGVVAKALNDGRGSVGAAAIRMLSAMAPACTGDCAVAAALAGNNKEMRLAAAIALGRMGGYPDSATLVAALAEVLSQDALRTVVVIDDQEASRLQLVAELNARGYMATGIASGSQGLSAVRQMPVEDLVIVRYDLKDRTSHEVVKTLRGDSRTSETPVVLLADENGAATATEQFGAKVQLVLTTPLVAAAYEPQVRALLKTLDAARETATASAAMAAAILSHMPGSAAAAAGETLLAAVNGEDRVRIPAMKTLGNIGNAAARPALIAVFADATASDAARGAAIIAAARIARAGGSPCADTNAVIGAGLLGCTGELKASVATAAGIAPVDAALRAQWLNALRASVAVNLGG